MTVYDTLQFFKKHDWVNFNCDYTSGVFAVKKEDKSIFFYTSNYANKSSKVTSVKYNFKKDFISSKKPTNLISNNQAKEVFESFLKNSISFEEFYDSVM